MWTWSRSDGSSGRVLVLVPVGAPVEVDENGSVASSRNGSKRPSKSTIATVLHCGGAIKVATRR